MNKKKIFSILLTFCMVLTLFSGVTLPALAEDVTWTEVTNRAELGEAIADGAHIRLAADITGGRITIPEETAVTLDLNGKTLSRGLAENDSHPESRGNAIYLLGTLVIEDSSGDDSGKITGGFNRSGFGGGIQVFGGHLTLNAGSICDNVVSTYYGRGGGVDVSGGGSFTMNGGLIYDNAVACGGIHTYSMGGGVCVSDATFTMNGGRIFSCGTRTGQYNVNRNASVESGGGVAVDCGGVFNMTGGQIGGVLDVSANTGIDNQALAAGGAVYLAPEEESDGTVLPGGVFHMTGGTITAGYCSGGKAGGVYVGEGASFTLSGDSNIAYSVGNAVYVEKTARS